MSTGNNPIYGGSGSSFGALGALAVPRPPAGAHFVNEVWRDLASYFTPTNMNDAFRLCEFLYLNFPTYRKGSERVVDYFLTHLKLSNGDDNERKKFKEILEDDIRVMSVLREIGLNYMTYGNALVSPHFPFLRQVKCRSCHSTLNVKQLEGNFKMDWKTGDFHAFCRKCNQTLAHQVVDYARMDPKGIGLISWDPKQINIETNMLTGESQYWYEVPEYTRREIRDNNPFFLATTPKPFLDAVRGGKKFKFHPNSIFHLREPRLAGIDLRGWGVPSVLSAFRNFFRLQILQRQDEKLMVDYITPLRMLSPRTFGSEGGNTIVNSSMQNWMGNMDQMIQRHRMDGANWNLVPFPVEYQAIGGEGQQLSPKGLIESEEDRLLNARGVPPEFYRASLTLQAAPVALRLFERSWSSLVNGQNKLLRWWTTAIAHYLRSGEYKVELESVTIVDDIDSKIWRLQAMASELLSKETALSPMGINSKEEYDRLLEQQKYEAKMTEEAQREMEMASISLDNEGGGGEGQEATGQGGGQTPGDLNAQADQMARELLALPEGDRHRQLASIRQTNDTLHALVLKKMDQLRTQARSVGQDMAMEQVVQQGAPAQEGAPAQAAPPQ